MWSFSGVSSPFAFFWTCTARLSRERSGLSPGTDPGRAMGASVGTLARPTAPRGMPRLRGMSQREVMLWDVAVECRGVLRGRGRNRGTFQV